MWKTGPNFGCIWGVLRASLHVFHVQSSCHHSCYFVPFFSTSTFTSVLHSWMKNTHESVMFPIQTDGMLLFITLGSFQIHPSLISLFCFFTVKKYSKQPCTQQPKFICQLLNWYCLQHGSSIHFILFLL